MKKNRCILFLQWRQIKYNCLINFDFYMDGKNRMNGLFFNLTVFKVKQI